MAELVKGAGYARPEPAQTDYRNLFFGCRDENAPDGRLATLIPDFPPEVIIRFRVSVTVYPLYPLLDADP